MADLPQPLRGEIWDVHFPSDPPGKGPRPVLIVSTNARNKHPKASTVLVVPFSTTLSEFPTHIRLAPGETGLPAPSELQPEQISSVRKESLKRRPGTRTQPESIISRVAKNVVFSLGVQPKNIQ
ncbi:MAG: type II toxin-antitoxin system PemK/MazF family toxin [Candidatus Acidiferrales bacterium]